MLPDVRNDMPDVAHELHVQWVVLSSPALQLEGDNIKHMHLIMCEFKMIRLLHAATRGGTYTQTNSCRICCYATYIISLAALESTHAVYIEHENEPCNRSPGALRPIWGMGPRRSAITMLGMLTRSANTPFVIHLCMSMHVAMHLGTYATAMHEQDTMHACMSSYV